MIRDLLLCDDEKLVQDGLSNMEKVNIYLERTPYTCMDPPVVVSVGSGVCPVWCLARNCTEKHVRPLLRRVVS